MLFLTATTSQFQLLVAFCEEKTAAITCNWETGGAGIGFVG